MNKKVLVIVPVIIALQSLVFSVAAFADMTTDDTAPYQYQAPALADGSLIASISFDQADADISKDASGNGNDAAMSDDAVYADHNGGYALSLDGSSSGALIADDIIGVGSVTVCLDFNANTAKAHAKLIDDGSFSISVDETGNIISSDGQVLTQVQPGSWQHVCASHVSDASVPQGSAVAVGSSVSDDQHGFDGLIDNVDIYQGIVSGR
jgi:hypothetical protein